jgi:hypothetical protein
LPGEQNPDVPGEKTLTGSSFASTDGPDVWHNLQYPGLPRQQKTTASGRGLTRQPWPGCRPTGALVKCHGLYPWSSTLLMIRAYLIIA